MYNHKYMVCDILYNHKYMVNDYSLRNTAIACVCVCSKHIRYTHSLLYIITLHTHSLLYIACVCVCSKHIR